MFVTKQAMREAADSPTAQKVIDAAKHREELEKRGREEAELLRAAFEAERPWGPLPGREPPGPFPVGEMPALGAAMAITVADSVQVSEDMAACLVLGAVSAAAAGRVRVRVNAAHEEPCHLFIAMGADPSERKSACMAMVFDALYRYEQEENERRAPQVRMSESTRKMLEDQLAKAGKEADKRRMAELIGEIEALEDVRPYELILTDTTPEALSKAMARNGGRMAVVSSEGAFFNILSGSYSSAGAVNVDVVLKGYSGEPVRVERVGRAGEKIDRACLSLCLAVQPEMLQDFLNDPTLAARGMASRFLAMMPRSKVGERREQGIPADETVMERFAERIRQLLSDSAPLTLPLSEEARLVYGRWFDEVERDLRPGGELKDLGQGWGGKLCGNTARLAGLMTLLREEREAISGDTMARAVAIARWFRDQALRLMGGEVELSPEANEMLGWLVRRGENGVSQVKIKQAIRRRTTFNKTETVQDAFTELSGAGFIRFVDPPKRDGAGRPSCQLLELHPSLLKSGTEPADGG